MARFQNVGDEGSSRSLGFFVAFIFYNQIFYILPLEITPSLSHSTNYSFRNSGFTYCSVSNTFKLERIRRPMMSSYLDNASNLFVLASFGILYALVACFSSWRRLRHIPGPKAAGWTKLWLLKYMVSGTLCTKLGDVCSKYGKLVRIGPDWVVCGDASEIQRIWGVRSGFSRAPWYTANRLRGKGAEGREY